MLTIVSGVTRTKWSGSRSDKKALKKAFDHRDLVWMDRMHLTNPLTTSPHGPVGPCYPEMEFAGNGRAFSILTGKAGGLIHELEFKEKHHSIFTPGNIEENNYEVG
jgi:hypothetical protein